MALEQTLCIIKPDSIRTKNIGHIIERIEQHFSIRALKMLQFTEQNARLFYKEHEGKEFFQRLLTFMTSGSIIAILLEGENAIARYRALMGNTNPLEADTGTIRGDLAMSKTENLVHGSDSPQSAAREINFFFSKLEQLHF